MARKIEKETVDTAAGPVTFEVTQEGFVSARATFVRVAKAVGPALAALAEGSPSLRSLQIAPALARALEGLSEDDLAFLSAKFGASTRYSTDGKKWPYLDQANQEELFSGSMLLFFQWLYFALRVNFSDFFGALLALKGSGQEGETQAP